MGSLSALFVGGTGTISSACVARALSQGIDVTMLNRGLRSRAGTEARAGAGTEAGAGAGTGAGAEAGADARLAYGAAQAVGGARGKLKSLVCDINDEQAASRLLDGERFDAVADFVAFTREQVERDIRLFEGRARQYLFISSASVYKKPSTQCKLTECTALANPFWQYARDKIECELTLNEAFRRDGFPATIVRPSHTYGDHGVPVGIHGANGSWQVLARILCGKPVLVHGDGTSWWTFTHADDFAAGFVGLIGNPSAKGEAVHITSDEYLSWNEAYHVIGNALGREPVLAHVASEAIARRDHSLEGPLLGDKANPLVFDNTKIKRLVPGFYARVRFDQGVRRAVAHMMAHPEQKRPDPSFDGFCDEMIAAYCH